MKNSKKVIILVLCIFLAMVLMSGSVLAVFTVWKNISKNGQGTVESITESTTVKENIESTTKPVTKKENVEEISENTKKSDEIEYFTCAGSHGDEVVYCSGSGEYSQIRICKSEEDDAQLVGYPELFTYQMYISDGKLFFVDDREAKLYMADFEKDFRPVVVNKLMIDSQYPDAIGVSLIRPNLLVKNGKIYYAESENGYYSAYNKEGKGSILRAYDIKTGEISDITNGDNLYINQEYTGVDAVYYHTVVENEKWVNIFYDENNNVVFEKEVKPYQPHDEIFFEDSDYVIRKKDNELLFEDKSNGKKYSLTKCASECTYNLNELQDGENYSFIYDINSAKIINGMMIVVFHIQYNGGDSNVGALPETYVASISYFEENQKPIN